MRTKQFTQHQKILGYMISRKDQQEWFFAYDFMPPRMTLDYIYCVGYEASARFTELATRYPDMVETQQAGKYKRRRIRWATMHQWLPQLAKDLRYMFHRAGVTKAGPLAPDPPADTMIISAVFKGRPRHGVQFNVGETHKLVMEKLKVGSPVIVTFPAKIKYADVKAFQKDWRAL